MRALTRSVLPHTHGDRQGHCKRLPRILAALFLAALLSGCNPDRRAYEAAKSRNTEIAYLAYLRKFPDGQFRREALRLADLRAWEKAKSGNTEAAYLEYARKFPAGEFRRQARRLADLRAFEKAKTQGSLEALNAYLKVYDGHRHEARAAIRTFRLREYHKNAGAAIQLEGRRLWSQALRKWGAARECLRLDAGQVDREVTKLRRHALAHSVTCLQRILRPVELSGQKVTGTYQLSLTKPGRRYTSFRVTGRITNHLPSPISRIVLSLGIHGRYLDWYPVSSDGTGQKSKLLGSVKQTVCTERALQPGETRTFSFEAPLSARLGWDDSAGSKAARLDAEPNYSLEVASYRVAGQQDR